MEEEKESPVKRQRARKKLTYNNIRKQMEFYFSDANITKDRFLGKMVNDNPFVPLEVFLTFNRMKQLTESTKDIVKALGKSQFLELSEDEMSVRRRTKINWGINSDESTIYVEGLPAKADHEWIKNAFGGYGNVMYVSLPKYSGTQRIKQFGFVEFENINNVEKTIEEFQKFGGILSSEMDPAGLQSVVTFNQEQQNKIPEDIPKVSEEESGEEAEEPAVKRAKVEEPNEENETPEVDDAKSESLQEKEKQQNEQEKKRTRRKRHKSKKKTSTDTIFDLKIMTKKEWKRLRNKYLNLQREKFKEAKIAFQGPNSQRNTQKSPTLTISKSPGSMNFYGDPQPVPSSGISMPANGLIVEIKLVEPVVDVKDFKAELRQHDFVKYVDVKEGTMVAYVRVDTPESAEELVRQYTDPERMAAVLSGDAEEAYWKKIAQDRDAKIKKIVKVDKPKRGREKIKKKINQHIFFDGDEDKE